MALRSRCYGTAMALAAVAFAIYLANPRPMARGDSYPTRLLPYSIALQGNLDLDEFTWLRAPDRRSYFLVEGASGRWFSMYPVASSFLALPLVAPVAWELARESVPLDDVRFRLATVVTERVAAAAIAAFSVALLFLAALQIATPTNALAVTAVYAFGTNLWSTSSQALWQHGPAALALAAASLMLLREPTRRRTVAAGAWVALAVLVRAPMLAFALAALSFVAIERRRYLPWFLPAPIVAAALLLLYNSTLRSTLTGGYDAALFEGPSLEALAGLLISPNRGLLIFTPVALCGLFAPLGDSPRWLRYLRFGLWAQLGLYACWGPWHGGNSYGPRLLSDGLPALALCATPLVERLRTAPKTRALLCVLAAWGVLVQFVGVRCDDARVQHSTDYRADAWDLRKLQIARTIERCAEGSDSLLPLIAQVWQDPRPVAIRELPAQALTGTVDVSQLPSTLEAGERVTLNLGVSNLSDVAWPAFVDCCFPEAVQVEARWWGLSEPGLAAAFDAPLPRNLQRGDEISLSLPMRAPERSGDYVVELVVIQRSTREKTTVGNARFQQTVHVEPQRGG